MFHHAGSGMVESLATPFCAAIALLPPWVLTIKCLAIDLAWLDIRNLRALFRYTGAASVASVCQIAALCNQLLCISKSSSSFHDGYYATAASRALLLPSRTAHMRFARII